MLFLYLIVILIVNFCLSFDNKPPSVLITIFARNKAHTLPHFLTCLEDLDYPKDRISLIIRSDHNEDDTVTVLKTWIESVKNIYHSMDVNLESYRRGYDDTVGPAHWDTERFLNVINLKEDALSQARTMWADYIWLLDCDVFLTNPQTLSQLVTKDYPVVAPMLNSEGLYSNFWCGMTKEYYYQRTEDYKPILNREKQGCFQVPMVHSAVLINLNKKASDSLTFISENVPNYEGPTDDIITFALSANFSGVPLYVCNDQLYGFVMVPLEQTDNLAFDLEQLSNLKLEILIDKPKLPTNDVLSRFVTKKVPDKFDFDEIYMINLVRRPERRVRMIECFEELGLDGRIFDAVDGRTLTDSYLEDLGIHFMPEYADPYHKRAMTHGEIGCFLSHYNIWKQVVDNGFDKVMVLEDDVRFEPFFRQKIRNLMAEIDLLQLEWDLIYLGRKWLQEEEKWVEGSTRLVYVSYSYWTLGYLLSQNGAKKLLAQQPLKNLVPVDEYLPILFDRHPEKTWKEHFPKRDLVAFSVAPLLLYPTHYTGEKGYISDTEDSKIIDKKDEL